MKSIKNHIMFILPLLAILMGVESFLVFNRVTASYGKNLKEAYTILVLADKNITTNDFKKMNKYISSSEKVEKASVVEEISKGLPGISSEEIIKKLPEFYALHLDRYLSNIDISKIKRTLIIHKAISRVETFGQAHNANYNLYMMIKVTLWIFVSFILLTSIFLVFKQMEIWQLGHRDRMQVMEILGASGMLRSGVLFRIALTDAVIATLTTVAIFAFIKYVWVSKSEIDFLIRKQSLLFEAKDAVMLGGIALTIVIVSIIVVVNSVKENRNI